MSDKMNLLAEALFRNLLDAVLAQSACAENNYSGASFYGLWFHSPLAQNTYAPLVCAPVRQAQAPVNKPTAVKPVEDKKPDIDDKRKQIKLMSSEDMLRGSAQQSAAGTFIDLSDTADEDAETPAVAVVSSTGARNRLDTITTTFGAEQRQAVESLKEQMDARFGSAGVISKIAQTLLVLALEPADLGMEIVLLQRFDTNLVVENLLHMEAAVRQQEHPPAFFGEDDEQALEEGERLREFRRQFKKMTVNFFPRFPELAIECNETSSIGLLRAVSSLWIASSTLFVQTRVLPHSETARQLHDRFAQLLTRVLADRAPLLYAAVVTNVEGIGVKRWRHFRDLFVAALLDAYMHTTLLQREAPTDARFPAAARALRQTYERVRHYVHSKAK